MTLHAAGAGDRFLLARRYASAGIAMASCLCLSVSVISRCSVETDGWIVFFACRLLSTSPTLWYKEIQLSTEIRVIPLELRAKIRT